VSRPSPGRARALAVAAIRELAEETGLLLGDKQAGAAAWPAFAEAGVMPDLGGLYFVARAITPPRRLKRFDTRFFVADAQAVAHRVEGLVTADSELVELVWMPLTAARELDMVTVTKVVLGELEARLAEGLSHAQPVPFYRMINRRIVRELL
jgi:8-oxo-dGTP pyrophosphatase MutT (NUDIX family)